MRRRPSPYASSFSFGPPGPISTAMKAIIAANVVAFIATTFMPALITMLGLTPVAVVERLYVWQLGTYMFLHGGIFHLLFNMLALWMFGTELLSSISGVGGVANATHLGGIVVGYLFLKSGRIHPMSELKYRYLKYKLNRERKKFHVYSGGRADDYDRRVH